MTRYCQLISLILFGIVPLLSAQTQSPKLPVKPSVATVASDRRAAAEKELAADLVRAKAELNANSRRIAEERKTRLQRLTALERELGQLQDKIQATTAATTAIQKQTEQAIKQQHNQERLTRFIATMLREYRRAFETRISSVMREQYAPDLDKIDQLLQAASPRRQLDALEPLLQLSTRYLDRQWGGCSFPGKVLDPSGKLLNGTLISAGPLAFFQAEAGTPAGPLVEAPDSLYPMVLPVADPSGIQALAGYHRATIALDATAGGALQIRRTEGTWLEHLRQGGVIMIPLLLLAVFCLLIGLYKMIELHFIRPRASESVLREILAAVYEQKISRALELADSLRRPLAPVIREGIAHRNAPRENIEEIMYERILAQAPVLERLLTPLAVCAGAAPLLGLLGTVTGMIHTFRLITVFGSGDARLLSSGISEALITTEVGLMIAVPTLLVHAYLARRVRTAIAAAQQSAVLFVNELKLQREKAETKEPVS